MSGERAFVCGFYGARDGYEVATALQEAGLLEVLLTDFYGSSGVLAKAGLLRASREHAALPADKVQGSLALSLAKRVCGRIFADPEQRNLWPDRLLARRIARQARRRNAHIFTYEPYAVPRPADGFPHGRKQVVFYYHPHVDTEDAIYREDEKRWPKFHVDSSLLASPWRRRTADAWKQADLVICASSFTKQSLVAAGMPEERGVVVPYGTAQLEGEVTEVRGQVSGIRDQRSEVGGQPERSVDSVRRSRAQRSERNVALKLLFVGRNPLRKGLHHLLMAWNAAQKRPGDLLTIVCATRPLEMQRLVEGCNDVRWLSSVSGEELDRLYAEADALVVPSLCEGFGHVYLEAMRHGCAVVGTRNSALLDIGGETEGVFAVRAGDPDSLATILCSAADNPAIFRGRAEAARQRATFFTWEKFRCNLAGAVGSSNLYNKASGNTFHTRIHG